MNQAFYQKKNIQCPSSVYLFVCLLSADVSAYRSSISTNVIVTSEGNVTWLSMMIFRSSCAVDVRYFPFDEQNCTMLFASWTYDGYQLNIVKVSPIYYCVVCAARQRKASRER